MTCSGIVVFDIDALQPVLITSIKTNPKEEWGERLHYQRNIIASILEKFPPEQIYFERGFTRFNDATQIIFRVVGVYNEVFHEYKHTYFVPSMVKKTIANNGKCSKADLKDAIKEKYPDCKFRNEDESDAMGVVLTGMIKDYKMKW